VKPYRFHPAALAELEAAALWYAERSPEAARRFMAAVDTAIASIREKPHAWPPWVGLANVRRRVLRSFPYSIMFLVHADELVIIAVAHHKRRPGYWRARAGH